MKCDTAERLYVYSVPKTSNISPSFSHSERVEKAETPGSNHGFLSFSAPRLGGDKMPHI